MPAKQREARDCVSHRLATLETVSVVLYASREDADRPAA
jgi:hypothetical protein